MEKYEKFILNTIKEQLEYLKQNKELICLDKKNEIWQMFNYKEECKYFFEFLIKYLIDEKNIILLETIPNNFIERASILYKNLNDEKSRETFIWLLRYKIAALLTENITITNELYPVPQLKIEHNENNVIFKSYKNKEVFFVDGYTIISDYKEIIQTWVARNYELVPFCKIRYDDVIIDGGAYKGETALWFASQTGKNGKVYAFEIHSDNILIIKNNIINNDMSEKIKVVEKGLWSENKNVNIVTEGMKDTSYFCEENDNLFNKNRIDTIDIDSFIEYEKLDKIDMIKMDIEGAEEKAILGSLKTLRQFKPKLAIALYHKFFDFIDLPLLVMKINPNYKIYLSHIMETVLFAC